MEIVEKLKNVVAGDEEEHTGPRTYECQACGNVFESVKAPTAARCVECGSRELDVLGRD